jgi:hypothetical protein
LFAFKEYDVITATQSQVVRNAATDNAATDDYDACILG